MPSGYPRPPSRLPDWLRPVNQRLTPLIKYLLLVFSVPFLILVMVPQYRTWVAVNLVLSPVGPMTFWKPFTSFLIYQDPVSWFFGMLGLWFVGAALERAYGSRRFLRIFLLPGILAMGGAAVTMAVLPSSRAFAGPGFSILGLFVGMGVLYGSQEVRVFSALTLRAWVLSAFLVGIHLLGAVLALNAPDLIATLIAVTVAFAVAGGNWTKVGRFVSKNFAAWGRDVREAKDENAHKSRSLTAACPGNAGRVTAKTKVRAGQTKASISIRFAR